MKIRPMGAELLQGPVHSSLLGSAAEGVWGFGGGSQYKSTSVRRSGRGPGAPLCCLCLYFSVVSDVISYKSILMTLAASSHLPHDALCFLSSSPCRSALAGEPEIFFYKWPEPAVSSPDPRPAYFPQRSVQCHFVT